MKLSLTTAFSPQLQRLTAVATMALLAGTTPLALATDSQGQAPQAAATRPQHGGQLKHIIVIYQENWSFDALYGQFPGANGLANGFDHLPQRDKSTNYSSLIYMTPQPLNNGAPDNRFPPGNGQPALPEIPYDFTNYVPDDATTGDIVHKFYHEQLQIDNGVLEPSLGVLDKFVTWSDNPGLVLSYADATPLPEGQLAQLYTICDNFFHSAYGGSFLNHQFLAGAAAPLWEQPIPAGFLSSYDPATKTLVDSNLTTDGSYVVNSTFGAQAPHPASVPAANLLNAINDRDPSQDDYTPTIGDRLDAKRISWKWYSGGWNDAVSGNPDPLFQFHHQPFAYYKNFAPYNADGTINRAHVGPKAHLQDEKDFFVDARNGTLPAVSFIKPLGPDNEHPGYASLLQGQQHVADLVAAVQQTPAWRNTAIIITYDENGGRWDHVAPTQLDRWGYGTRVPTIIVSPFVRAGYIDHNQYETVSILKLIEKQFALPPLSPRDANPAVSDLTTAFTIPIGR